MDKALTGKQIFKKVYKGQNNFMTPHPIKYFKTTSHAIELAQGRGIMGQNIYGVSVIDIDPRSEDYMDRCQSYSGELFQSMTSALYYIGRIKDSDRQRHVPCKQESPEKPQSPESLDS